MNVGRRLFLILGVVLLVSVTPGSLGADSPLDRRDRTFSGDGAAAGIPSKAAQQEDSAVIEISLNDIFFEPRELEIPADQGIIVRLVNEGSAPHNFSIDALEIDVDVAPGESKEVALDAPAGDYEFYCNVPGHKEAGMVGTLHVLERPGESDGSPVPDTAASPVAAPDPAGCEGLAAYAEAMLAVRGDFWRSLETELGLEKPDDVFLLDDAGFLEMARLTDDHQVVLRQISPPAFAAEWHQTWIAEGRLLGEVARTAAGGTGIFDALLMHSDEVQANDARAQVAYSTAKAACPGFADFWRELEAIDGDPADAEPDAYSMCPGLSQYDRDLERASLQAFANLPEIAPLIWNLLGADESEGALSIAASEELIAVGEYMAEYRNETANVVPPGYAREWHASKVAELGLVAAFFEFAAEEGVDAAGSELEEDLLAQSADVRAAIASATSECPVFAQFAEEHD